MKEANSSCGMDFRKNMAQDKKNNAAKIIKTLLNAGYAAFYVGGCVRDMIMGNIPEDFDIATSAKPDDIIRLAGGVGWRTVTVGQMFGVVVIVIGCCQYEVATFRTDTYGQDSHRPSSVRIVERIEEDLARRDFTINAMAMDIDGILTDPFGGISDLSGKIVRAVGNPDERFAEDALRMFRAIRFAARFNFTIEPATFAAIVKNLDRTRGLSVERVSAEIEKTLLADYPAAGISLFVASGLAGGVCRVRVQKIFLPVDIFPELCYLPPGTMALLTGTPRRITLRWAALLYLIAQGMRLAEGMQLAENNLQSCRQIQPEASDIEKVLAVLARLKIKSGQVKKITWLIRHYHTLPPNRPCAIVQWLGLISRGFSDCREMRSNLASLLILCKAGCKSSLFARRRLKNLTGRINKTSKTLPFFAGQLAIPGGKIAAALGFGSQVKKFQLDSLDKIQKGVLKNTPGDLLAVLAEESLKQH